MMSSSSITGAGPFGGGGMDSFGGSSWGGGGPNSPNSGSNWSVFGGGEAGGCDKKKPSTIPLASSCSPFPPLGC